MELINIKLLIEKLYSGKESILPDEYPLIIDSINKQLGEFQNSLFEDNFSMLFLSLVFTTKFPKVLI